MDSSLVRNWNEEDAELYEKKSSKIVLNDLYLLTSETSMLEQVICDCAAGSCRPNSCTNALGHIQCSEQCKCENNWFKSVDSKKYLEPFLTGSEELGVGIRAKIDIKRGDIVGEYIGRLRSKEDYDYLRRTKYSADKHFYAMSIQQKQSYNGITIPEAVLDATKYSNRTKWINHCKKRPNLQVEIWRVQGHPRAYFRAIYRLPKGTELTYDYGMDEWNPEKCLCSNCSPNEYAKPFIPIPEHNIVRKRKRDKSVDIIARKSARIESQRPPLPVSVSVQTDAVEENAAISEPEAVETKHVGVPKTYVCEVCNK
ncbi:unnamed protein product [Orchesella dallaii]|uniref:SET domain-containing protein n=1 Tax=Orchesella dallaii TaxID=48710 RepID=A0ABP1S1L0_9HEXA